MWIDRSFSCGRVYVLLIFLNAAFDLKGYNVAIGGSGATDVTGLAGGVKSKFLLSVNMRQ